jgi:hypothetical protein
MAAVRSPSTSFALDPIQIDSIVFPLHPNILHLSYHRADAIQQLMQLIAHLLHLLQQQVNLRRRGLMPGWRRCGSS